MKRVHHLLLATLVLIGSGMASAQTGSTQAPGQAPVQEHWQAPWKNEQVAIVIDPFEGNEIAWIELAKDARVVGVIHRATIGARKDAKYAERKAEAASRGYKWGSYHLGKPGDPITQADFYLDTVRPSGDEVIALDIESLDPTRDMSLAHASKFIQRIREKTGRFPMLYANQTVVKQISDAFGRDEVFAKTPLWYARFRSRVTDFPTKTWDGYTLWQFSSEINCRPAHPENCLYRVPGTLTDMDVNVYRGTVEELKANWPFTKVVMDRRSTSLR